MKNHLILVRHSLPDVVEGLPARNWSLSEEGRRRAERLVQRLTPFRPEVIVSSAEPKALETAKIVASALQMGVAISEGLHEHKRETVPYLVPDVFEKSVLELFERPDQIVFGDESADQAHQRFSEAVAAAVKLHASRTVCIIAHGTVISLLVSRLTGICAFELWKELGLPSFVVLDLDANEVIARENNI